MTTTNTGHEVEDTIRELKKIPGFHSYCILNNDGIVIKFENMSYKTSVHYAHLVLGLTSKASKYVRDLFDPPDNEVDSIRIRSDEHEMIISQHGNFTIIVTQTSLKIEPTKVQVEEKKEGDVEAKKEAS